MFVFAILVRMLNCISKSVRENCVQPSWVVCLTARINDIFISFSTVQIYDLPYIHLHTYYYIIYYTMLLLCLYILSPHNKGLPHPEVSKCWNFDKSFVVCVLLLPPFKGSKLCFIVTYVSNSFRTYCVVIRMVDFWMPNNPVLVEYKMFVNAQQYQ